MIEASQPAPGFTLLDQCGEPATLSQHRDRLVVLSISTEGDTPVCTKEACAFRGARADYKKDGAKVVGVRPDRVPSHQKLADKL